MMSVLALLIYHIFNTLIQKGKKNKKKKGVKNIKKQQRQLPHPGFDSTFDIITF